MRNKHRGTCYRCGKTVEIGAGHFEKKAGGGWRVQHASCAIKYRVTAHEVVNPISALNAAEESK